MPMIEWKIDSSVRVRLEVTTPFTAPTVTMNLRREPSGQLVVGAGWPLALAAVPGDLPPGVTGIWEVVIPGQDLDLSVGNQLRVEVVFTDGAQNHRTFTAAVSVVRG